MDLCILILVTIYPQLQNSQVRAFRQAQAVCERVYAAAIDSPVDPLLALAVAAEHEVVLARGLADEADLGVVRTGATVGAARHAHDEFFAGEAGRVMARRAADHLPSIHEGRNHEADAASIGAGLARAALAGKVDGAADTEVPAAFAAALDDDLGVPQALAVVHDTVRAGNAALSDGDTGGARNARDEVVAMLDVLGVNPYAEPWAAQSDDGAARRALGPLVDVVLAQRQAARDRKDFAVADALRDGLASSGIAVEDTPAGPRWSLAEES